MPPLAAAAACGANAAMKARRAGLRMVCLLVMRPVSEPPLNPLCRLPEQGCAGRVELHRGKKLVHVVARIGLANSGKVRARLVETSGERLRIGGDGADMGVCIRPRRGRFGPV